MQLKELRKSWDQTFWPELTIRYLEKTSEFIKKQMMSWKNKSIRENFSEL